MAAISNQEIRETTNLIWTEVHQGLEGTSQRTKIDVISKMVWAKLASAHGHDIALSKREIQLISQVITDNERIQPGALEDEHSAIPLPQPPPPGSSNSDHDKAAGKKSANPMTVLDLLKFIEKTPDQLQSSSSSSAEPQIPEMTPKPSTTQSSSPFDFDRLDRITDKISKKQMISSEEKAYYTKYICALLENLMTKEELSTSQINEDIYGHNWIANRLADLERSEDKGELDSFGRDELKNIREFQEVALRMIPPAPMAKFNNSGPAIEIHQFPVMAPKEQIIPKKPTSFDTVRLQKIELKISKNEDISSKDKAYYTKFICEQLQKLTHQKAKFNSKTKRHDDYSLSKHEAAQLKHCEEWTGERVKYLENSSRSLNSSEREELAYINFYYADTQKGLSHLNAPPLPSILKEPKAIPPAAESKVGFKQGANETHRIPKVPVQPKAQKTKRSPPPAYYQGFGF